MLRVRVDTRAIERQLTVLARRQLPFATASALNDTARAAATQVNAAMPSIFDRVAPFTKRAVAAPTALAARKDRLQATVLVQDAQARYLGLEETGGVRTPADTLGGSRALVIPTKRARLNARGSMPKGYVAQLAKRAEADMAKGLKRAAAGKAGTHAKGIVKFTGAGPDGQGPGGFFLRTPGHLVRLISFASEARYRPKFNFRGRVQTIVQKEFGPRLQAALARALTSARR